MVLKVEAVASRDDWFNIKELQKPYQELKENIRGGDVEAAKNSFIFFKRSALTCYDLLFEDAKKLVAICRVGTVNGEIFMSAMDPQPEAVVRWGVPNFPAYCGKLQRRVPKGCHRVSKRG